MKTLETNPPPRKPGPPPPPIITALLIGIFIGVAYIAVIETIKLKQEQKQLEQAAQFNQSR